MREGYVFEACAYIADILAELKYFKAKVPDLRVKLSAAAASTKLDTYDPTSFVKAFLTEARCRQFFDAAAYEKKNTNAFINVVLADVMKESVEDRAANSITEESISQAIKAAIWGGVLMTWDFGGKQIIKIDFDLNASRYHSDDLSLLFDDDTRVTFTLVTDCCAAMSMRTSRKEFAYLIDKKLLRLEMAQTHRDVDYGSESFYNYTFHFSDGTEFDFDFAEHHGNGGGRQDLCYYWLNKMTDAARAYNIQVNRPTGHLPYRLVLSISY